MLAQHRPAVLGAKQPAPLQDRDNFGAEDVELNRQQWRHDIEPVRRVDCPGKMICADLWAVASWIMKRQLHLNLFIHSRGHHEASWRHPASSPLSLTDIRLPGS